MRKLFALLFATRLRGRRRPLPPPDPTSPPPPDSTLPPAPYARCTFPGGASTRPQHAGIAFGPTHVPTRELGGPFTGTQITATHPACLLADLEPIAGEGVAKAFADEGIDVLTDSNVVEVERPAPDAPVNVRVEGGREVEADEILVATGRLPATADVGIDTVGLEPGEAVEVDDRMRATGVDGDWLHLGDHLANA